MTRQQVEHAIYGAAEQAARDYWDGASDGVRGEIRDVYEERGLVASVEYLTALATDENDNQAHGPQRRTGQ